MERPKIFDRSRITLNRARALPSALFLHDLACELLKERLSDINRSFQNPAIIGWQAEKWGAALSFEATVYEANEDLNLPNDRHDLIIHGLEMHLQDDPLGQLIQMRRALIPDGLMVAVLLGGNTLSTLRSALMRAEMEFLGGASMRIAPMAEIKDLGALLMRAGFALPVADVFSQKVAYSGAPQAALIKLMHDLRYMGEGNAQILRPRRAPPRRLFTLASELYPHDGEAIEAEFDLCFLTGWAPSSTQPKPLRPGTAQISLIEALEKLNSNPRSK